MQAVFLTASFLHLSASATAGVTKVPAGAPVASWTASITYHLGPGSLKVLQEV